MLVTLRVCCPQRLRFIRSVVGDGHVLVKPQGLQCAAMLEDHSSSPRILQRATLRPREEIGFAN